MSTVSVILYSPARKDGKFPVCIRVGVKRKYNYEVLCYVKESHFNASAMQVRSYDPESPQMNIAIRRRFKEVTELLTFYDSKGWPFTGKDILDIGYADWKEKQKQATVKEKVSVPNGFIAYIQTVIIPFWKAKKNLANAEKYRLEADIFFNFLNTQYARRADYPMEKFNTELIASYFAYLRTKKAPCKKDSTLKRRLSQIEAVLNHAHQVSGVLETVPNIEIELNVLKPNKTKLTKEQIEQMENFDWTSNIIPAKVLGKGHGPKGVASFRLSVQTFLLQYYLFGARIGDMILLRNKSVITRNGQPVRIEYYQQKGRKKEGKRLMSVNLNAKLLSIVGEYWKPDKPDDFLLPWMDGRIDNNDQSKSPEQQAYDLQMAVHNATTLVNARLRLACINYIKLDVPTLASHSARHSFAQRAKVKGKSIEWIKGTLGHSTYDITAHYLADLDTEELNEKMADVYD